MLTLEQDDGVAVIRLAHGRVNALDLEFLAAIQEAVDSVPDDPIVLTGAGSCFSAGADLRRVVDDGAAYVTAFLTQLTATLLATFRHSRPVVAAINGHALAGGAVLALAADYRLMSAGTIGLTEPRVGVPFPTAAMQVARHGLGPLAGRLALTGDAFDPDSAARLGIVHEVCAPEDLLGAALARTRRLAGVRPEAYAFSKQQLHSSAERTIARDSDVDDAEVARQWLSRGCQDGITAFMAALPTQHRT